MTNETETKTGYAAKTALARIADIDIDACGNADRAAWKRYVVLSLLAMAKGTDKKAAVEAVFGKGNKPSKTFQNMWSLADKARNPMLGNRKWSDFALLSIEEALTEALGLLNRHMATLGVTSKNDYDKFATSSPEEIKMIRDREAAEKAAAAAATEAAKEAAKEATAEKEADAKAAAAAKPDRTAAEAAIAALHEASRDDLMSVMAHIATRIGAADLQVAHEEIGAMLDNIQKAAAAAAAA